MKLSEELELWHCDRPDEWKMDEFRRNAEKLEAERDALSAQVELFNNVRKQFNNTVMGEYEALMAMFELCCSDASDALAEVRAEAVLQAVKFFEPARDIDVEALESYAAKIRQGGAE